MSDRDRSDSGQFVETVTLDAVRDVYDNVRGPVVTSSDVANALDCTTEAARQKLTRLYDRGEVNKRKTGRTVVYWRTDTANESEARESREQAQDAPAVERDPSAVDTSPGGAHTESDAVGDALAEWEPDTQADAKSARGQTRRSTRYLREHAPERFKRGELQDALAGESSFSARHWWVRAVQPGLRHLAEKGLVEYRAGHHDYRWAVADGIDDADAQDTDTDPVDGGVYDPTEEF